MWCGITEKIPLQVMEDDAVWLSKEFVTFRLHIVCIELDLPKDRAPTIPTPFVFLVHSSICSCSEG